MILRNVSHNDKEIKDEINALVGKSFHLFDRIKKGGVGSPRLVVATATKEINELLAVDNRSRYSSLELRPKGVIMRFRSRLDTYAWVLPFSSLTLFKSAGFLELYSGGTHVKLSGIANSRSAQNFVRKLVFAKAEALQETGAGYYDYNGDDHKKGTQETTR